MSTASRREILKASVVRHSPSGPASATSSYVHSNTHSPSLTGAASQRWLERSRHAGAPCRPGHDASCPFVQVRAPPAKKHKHDRVGGGVIAFVLDDAVGRALRGTGKRKTTPGRADPSSLAIGAEILVIPPPWVVKCPLSYSFRRAGTRALHCLRLSIAYGTTALRSWLSAERQLRRPLLVARLTMCRPSRWCWTALA
jgi:hypothetical protein